MAKKRSAESEAEEGDTPPKRARVGDAPMARQSNVKGTQGGKRTRDEEESSADSDQENNADDGRADAQRKGNASQRRSLATVNDEDFEKKNVDRVRHSLDQRRTHNGPAEAGVISRLELHNFMCHKYVTFNLGPQVNFIIGQNGSGKSAALSAISIALGGKASSTGRAIGLKSFIKSGESAAEVTVTLKNGGHEAFKPSVYGNSIIITRTFNQNGNASYKIKGHSGKIVSNKKEELSAILDHYQIDVDNPMNILTQDLARQFLSASNPSEKYSLFLKGTLLTQLQEEYDLIRENCSKTKAILAQKKHSIEELEVRYKEAEGRHQKAQTLADAEDAIRELKRELAWAHVAEKEEEFSKSAAAAAEERQRYDQIQQKINEAGQQISEAEEKLNAAETRVQQASSPEELKEESQRLNAFIADRKKALAQAVRDRREIAEELKGKKGELAAAEKEIAEGHAKLARDAEREDVRRKIDSAQAAHNDADARYNNASVAHGKAKEAVEAYRQVLMTADREFGENRNAVQEAEGRVNTLRSHAGQGGPIMYGGRMPDVLKVVAETRWRGAKPVGPLGLSVRLKDHRWVTTLRLAIGNQLGGFAVTNHHDRITLRKILDDKGFRNTGILVSEPDIYDYSAGEPQAGVLTVLRVLEISDEWVARILINALHIERVLLSPSRMDAERLLVDYPRSTAWTADGLRVQRYPDGGSLVSQIGGRIGGPHDFRGVLFTEDRHEEELAHATRTLGSLESEHQAKSNAQKEAQAKYRVAEQECSQAKRHVDECLSAAKRTYRELESAKAEDVQEKPIDLAAQEGVAEDLRAEVDQHQRSLADADDEKTKIDDEMKPVVLRLTAVRDEMRRYEQRQSEISVEVAEAVTEQMKAVRAEKHYRDKLEEQQAKLTRAEASEQQLGTEYTNWRARIEERYEEFVNPKSTEALQKKLKAKEASLNRGIQEQGQSLEEVINDLARAKAAWEKARSEYRDINTLVNLLRRSLNSRMSTWQGFRQFISLRCKLSFQYYLSNRGFFGSIILDHENGSLALKVQTEEDGSKKGKAQEKDAKMSGGEKSFATICLLMALWDAMGCPIRALDEFDVYMDAVNRRVSMKMMLDTAKSSDKQHILITPQDMGNVQIGPEVRVHRMHDPERGQQVLPYQAA